MIFKVSMFHNKNNKTRTYSEYFAMNIRDNEILNFFLIDSDHLMTWLSHVYYKEKNDVWILNDSKNTKTIIAGM